MPEPVQIWVDESQFPEAVARDLAESFRTRRVNHKFLYTSYRQAAKWLKLHEAHSPARNDPDCLATYDRAFAEAAQAIGKHHINLIGLGCGGGQKDARLAEMLDVTYTPVDVSLSLVVTAARRVQKVTHGIVCDLGTVSDLEPLLPKSDARLFTFFGMLPNFEPEVILPKLAGWLQAEDWLLVSANLTPAGGIEKVLPQYANALTEDWLRAFLEDFGVRNGTIGWRITDRISSEFVFAEPEMLGGVEFRAGEKLRLFFSLRYTPEELRKIFAQYGLQIQQEWITRSGEEGVFICRKR